MLVVMVTQFSLLTASSPIGPRNGLVFSLFSQLGLEVAVNPPPLHEGPVVALRPVTALLAAGCKVRHLDALASLLRGEAAADRQLASFKANPENQGKVCKVGLWRYSRHPNYFFEWVHWFAYLAIGARLSESIGYAALAGPVVMLVFLLFVTGVPYTEMRAVQSKGEAYRQYQRETSAFIPWFVKKA